MKTLIQEVLFDDETTHAMGEAFDHACESLRKFGKAATVREIIAKRIVEGAKKGERDPARLYALALQALDIDASKLLAA